MWHHQVKILCSNGPGRDAALDDLLADGCTAVVKCLLLLEQTTPFSNFTAFPKRGNILSYFVAVTRHQHRTKRRLFYCRTSYLLSSGTARPR